MIRPLFFPHSCLSDQERDVILSCFECVAVFRSLESKTPFPGVDEIIPVLGGEENLTSFLNEYRNFAALNMEKATAFLSGSHHKPLFDSTWAAELRSEIIRCMDDHAGSSMDKQEVAQELLWARAFIEIAHEYDEKNQEIDRELDRLANREKQLFDALMGEDKEELSDLTHAISGGEREASEIRIKHRLKAWATLFVSAWPDADKTGDGFFLTHSPAVIQECEEFVPSFHCMGHTVVGETKPEDLNRQIKDWVSKPYSGSPVRPKAGGLSFYIAPDLSPSGFFNRVLKTNHDIQDERPEIKNTVIGLVEL